jgi:cell shape-determining protein MreC
MVYKPFQQKKERNKEKQIFAFVAIFLLAIFNFFPSAWGTFSAFANKISVPFWLAGNKIEYGMSGFTSLLRSKQSLNEQNMKLLAEISNLRQKLSGYDFAVQDNLEMKKNLFGSPKEYLSARIISRPNVAAYDTFIIDAGSERGVKKGANILTKENVSMGIVEEVYSRSSKARLFSTAGQISNVLLGPENTPVEIRGMGGGTFIAEVPSGADIREGDTALLSENTDYIVAYVISKEKNSANSFQKFYLEAPTGLFTIKYVRIEKK